LLQYSTPGRIRTHDPLIRSQMLYPLSYGGELNPIIPQAVC
jgi:hypothetical protein